MCTHDRVLQGAVPLMHVGETFAFAIPADLAYGQKWRVNEDGKFASIPAGSALLFRITVIALPSCDSPSPTKK